jgi:glyoxylase-like metal-dependent hydrolase (beta-lactamase superfamily II)
MKYYLPFVLLIFYFPSTAQSKKQLSIVSKAIELISPKEKQVNFNFQQTHLSFPHGQRPWQTRSSEARGNFAILPVTLDFHQIDSTKTRDGYKYAYKFVGSDNMAVVDYGDESPSPRTIEDFKNQAELIGVYTPLYLLRTLSKHLSSNKKCTFNGGINSQFIFDSDSTHCVEILIDSETYEVRSISIKYNHSMYGDVLKSIIYDSYKEIKGGSCKYPSQITENELGIETNKTQVAETESMLDIQKIRSFLPPNYDLSPTLPEKLQVNYSKYNAHIHFLDIVHTDDKVMVVEFKDFLLVAESPLESKNGDLIIKKAKEIAPNKPIKYFVFGHHHPHYLGGVRPFVANGTTVLSTSLDSTYVSQVIGFKHSLQPDALEKKPKPLQLGIISGTKIISDGDLEIQIIHIGTQSQHTEDYLVYYFPKYKLLFEDDLVWIPLENTNPRPASGRQKGLYEAIIKNKLDVETIIQSWPLSEYKVKTIIPFAELERSCK